MLKHISEILPEVLNNIKIIKMTENWISIKDMEPEESGIYRVKMWQGSMSPKVVEMDCRFYKSENPSNRSSWQGAFDWNYVSHWMPLPEPTKSA